MIVRTLAIAAGAVLLAGFPAYAQARLASRLVFDTLRSTSLANDKFGDSPNREVLVYLPPSYDSSAATRYPVLYLLHGYGGTDRGWIRGHRGFRIQDSMDSLVAAHAAREMIIVMPNGNNRFGGSFYVNSDAGGDWDTLVSGELVSYIDRKYRTLARPASRGLAGHSMGGYGAFYLGMRHGGSVYGAVYALSGCCTRFADQVDANSAEIWEQIANVHTALDVRELSFYPAVFLALTVAFSSDVNKPPMYIDLPFEERNGMWEKVPPVIAEWSAHAPYDMVSRYAANLKRLRGLMFDVGTHDQLVAPASLALMDTAFTRAGVPHVFETYDGDHTNHIGDRMITTVLPFFSRMLDFSGARP